MSKQKKQLMRQYQILLKRLRIVPDSQYEKALGAFSLVKNEIIALDLRESES